MKHNVNNNWLGTCRGLAVICVVFTHFLPQIDDAFNLDSIFIKTITVDVIDIGKFGVAMLFLIAGYLTFMSKKRRTVKQFVVNRFFRLYPLYWLDIVLVGIIFAFDHHSLGTILANMTMLQVFLRKEDLVGVFWTLPIELLLYTGSVLFERFIWNYKKLLPLEILGTLGSVGLAIVRRKVWPAAPVAIGLLLTIGVLGQMYRLYKNKEITGKQLAIAIGIFEAGLIFASILAYQIDMGHQENWHRYVLSYSLAVIVFTLFMQTEKSLYLCTLVAVIAYPVYLLQEIVFRVAFGIVWQQGTNRFLFLICTLGVLIIVSVMAHVLIEKPMGKIENEIEKKLG